MNEGNACEMCHTVVTDLNVSGTIDHLMSSCSWH